jgi:hypothetical protein
MKTLIYTNKDVHALVRRKGGKTKSHGTHRAKRHPTSKRVRNA